MTLHFARSMFQSQDIDQLARKSATGVTMIFKIYSNSCYLHIFGIHGILRFEIITFSAFRRGRLCLIVNCSVNCHRFLSNRLLHSLTLGFISQNQIINKSEKRELKKFPENDRDLPINDRVFGVCVANL